jgi:predicted small lipoprotein YifL
VTGRATAAALLLGALAACGVKAPPRAAGAPDQATPSDLFRPVDDPNRPGVDFITTDEEVVAPLPGPAAPATAVTPATPAAPPAEETSR